MGRISARVGFEKVDFVGRRRVGRRGFQNKVAAGAAISRQDYFSTQFKISASGPLVVVISILSKDTLS